MNKLKSVNLMATSRCNSHCNMCGIWSSPDNNDIKADPLSGLFSAFEFSEVEDASISGGEPFLRNDIVSISETMIRSFGALKMLFINTNGLLPAIIIEQIKKISEIAKHVNPVLEIILSVSLEGPKEIHEIIRGRGYRQSLETIRGAKSLKMPNLKIMVSMTIQKINQGYILDVKKLAESLGCGFSFRFCDFSDNYYMNSSDKEISLTAGEKVVIMDSLKNYFLSDIFFKVLHEHVAQDKNSVMLAPNGQLICRAGEIFIFIKSDGNIYPCIYSHQIIGNIKDGLQNFALQRISNCPCCTECHIYPMLIYGKGKNN